MQQRPLVKGAFLGIGMSDVGPAFRAQLGLPEGTGLTVAFVDPQGPAKGVLRPFDVLTKLDDQILVNAEQLAVLVRMHKPGEEINLELLRAGRKESVKVKLGEKELPPLDTMFQSRRLVPMPMPSFPQFNGNNPMMFQRPGGQPLQQQPGRGPQPFQQQPGRGPRPFQQQPGRGPQGNAMGPGMPGGPPPPHPGNAQNPRPGHRPELRPGFNAGTTTTTSTSNSTGTFTVTVNGRTATLIADPINGERLICIAPDGKVAFNGSVATPEDKKKVPTDFQGLLDKLEKNRQRFPVNVQPYRPPAPNL